MPHYSGTVDTAPSGLTSSEIAEFEQLVRIAVSIFGVSSTGPYFCSFGLALFYSTFSPDRIDMLYQLTEKKPVADVNALAVLPHFKGVTTLIRAFEISLPILAAQGRVTAIGMYDDKAIDSSEDIEWSVQYRWNLYH